MNRWNTDFANEQLFFRVMPGAKSVYFSDCYEKNYIGVNFGVDVDLSNDLPENWREFNKKYIPIYLEKNPGKAKVTAGLACAAIHTVSKSLKINDFVISPDGTGKYYIGKIVSNYKYYPERPLIHCRDVEWLNKTIERSEMSEELRNSTGAINSVSNITKHSFELNEFIEGSSSLLISNNDEVEDASMFALERHLEDFLVENWENTELAKKFDIYQDEEVFGQQFQTDTGPIDILAISKDKKELLVIELKKGKASDTVVGQIQRYMGYIKNEFLEEGQIVKGAIIALEDSLKIKRALSVTSDIDFYRYKVNFELISSD
tara:strand:- start:57 stop:1010 length:954 start_codon:yes stop_codon:yes gene_type:complete